MQPRTKAILQMIAVWTASVIGALFAEDRAPFLLTYWMMVIYTISFLFGRGMRQFMRKYFLIVALAESVPLIVLYFTVPTQANYFLIFVGMLVWQRIILSLYNEYWGDTWGI